MRTLGQPDDQRGRHPKFNETRDNLEEFLKILEQADMIKKGGTWLKVHQQV